MIIASGTSNRHVQALVENVAEKAKMAGHRPIGVEGEEGGEWVLLDLQDALVHVMLPKVREFYNLEKLWSLGSPGDLAVTDR
jgi:ribosome-associated protein